MCVRVVYVDIPYGTARTKVGSKASVDFMPLALLSLGDVWRLGRARSSVSRGC